MMINGYYFKRSGQVQIILNPGWFDTYIKQALHMEHGILMIHIFHCFGMDGILTREN